LDLFKEYLAKSGASCWKKGLWYVSRRDLDPSLTLPDRICIFLYITCTHVYLYVYIHTYIDTYVWIQIHLDIYTHMYVCFEMRAGLPSWYGSVISDHSTIPIYICTYKYMYVYANTHTHTHIRIKINMFRHVHTNMCFRWNASCRDVDQSLTSPDRTYIYLCVHTYVYIYINTYTHPHIRINIYMYRHAHKRIWFLWYHYLHHTMVPI